MKLSLIEAALAIGGTTRGGDAQLNGVTTDSRNVQPGQLFVALRGERFDGHDFVKDVIAQGAAAALVDRNWAADQTLDLPLLAVDDTRIGLGHLAAYWRDKFAIPLLGITGSNGKTTVKEMCAAVLRTHLGADAVLATAGNFNNDIGLPLTLLGLGAEHKAAIIEMGMSHPGEIAYLTRIASPTVALVNNAQRAHLEGLGTVRDVAAAKGEIFQGLGADGIAVFNADDPNADLWRTLAANHVMLSYGLESSEGRRADVSGKVQLRHFSSLVSLDTPVGSAEFELPVPGLHNARNALGATAACLAAKVTLDVIVRGLGAYGGVKGRLQPKAGRSGARVVDDTYNANPDSMRAAVDVLAALPGKRIFVMGDMGEVGEAGGQFHDELGGYAKSMGIDRLYCLGDLCATAVHNFGEGGQHFDKVEALVKALEKELDGETTVLVKGSRFMRMERVVNAITDNGENNNAA
ncbi:MAG: UDP-N-acetylmuramoyl-tripeptide--D-alanyl-D-alanine ligase [Rhodocyclaceae bacterium]|nr:MAG: UDP-N-acetylmuramoyl-tripeptide--D-alanyl-D-alanine ligase [Rhodocyclaceae bacterium]